MTLPDERSRAIINTRMFLRSLLDRSATPRVPLEIRKQAYYLLKHYPSPFDMASLKRPLDLAVFKDSVENEE